MLETFLGLITWEIWIGAATLVVAIIALGFKRKQTKAMEKSADAQARSAKATERSQMHEQHRKAVEQLGHESASVRLGGARALIRFARDYPERRQEVLDTLCDHICQMTKRERYPKKYKSKPSKEIQSILTLIFLQKHDVFEDCRADLQRSYLNGAQLEGAWLKNADLGFAYLQETVLVKANLQGSRLSGAYLQKSHMMRARLEKANLDRSQLQGADMSYAQLQCASLRRAQMSVWDDGVPASNLYYAHLQGADLSEANMQHAGFLEAHLQGAILNGAHMEDAYFVGAHMHGSCIMGAHLHRTNLQYAELQGADLSYSRWEHTQLMKADMRGAKARKQIKFMSFKQRIRESIEKETNLTSIVIPSGVWNNTDLDNLGVIHGHYTCKEARQWITQYEATMAAIPKNLRHQRCGLWKHIRDYFSR